MYYKLGNLSFFITNNVSFVYGGDTPVLSAGNQGLLMKTLKQSGVPITKKEFEDGIPTSHRNECVFKIMYFDAVANEKVSSIDNIIKQALTSTDF